VARRHDLPVSAIAAALVTLATGVGDAAASHPGATPAARLEGNDLLTEIVQP
jgi:hypothetical protein